MTEKCPHCRQTLPDYWWERALPQSKWSKQQWEASSARQNYEVEYRKCLDALDRYNKPQGLDVPTMYGLDNSATPSQADEKGRPMTYWGGRPDNDSARDSG